MKAGSQGNKKILGHSLKCKQLLILTFTTEKFYDRHHIGAIFFSTGTERSTMQKFLDQYGFTERSTKQKFLDQHGFCQNDYDCPSYPWMKCVFNPSVQGPQNG